MTHLERLNVLKARKACNAALLATGTKYEETEAKLKKLVAELDGVEGKAALRPVELAILQLAALKKTFDLQAEEKKKTMTLFTNDIDVLIEHYTAAAEAEAATTKAKEKVPA